jgi:hypothetical protein
MQRSALQQDLPIMPADADTSSSHDWLDRFTAAPVLWGGTVLAAASIAASVRNGLRRAHDFQWSPAHLLAAHQDPWATYLAGDPHHKILLNQVPNYLHLLYVFMLPLGYLPQLPARAVFALLNVAMVLASCALLRRLYELPPRRAWLFALLVLTGTPFRVTVGNGQVTALVLLSITLWTVAQRAVARGLLLGVAWVKYSVPPVLALYLLLRRQWKLLFVSALPLLAGWLFFVAWLHVAPLSLATEPFRCAATNVSPGLANAMAVTELTLRHLPLFHPAPDRLYLAPNSADPRWAAYLVALAVALGLAAWVARLADRVDARVSLALLLAASLLCFKHQIYDFLLLALSLALVLRAPASRQRNLALALLLYFWYFERFLHIWRFEFWPAVVVVSFLLLGWLLLTLARVGTTISWAHPWTIDEPSALRGQHPLQPHTSHR